MSRFARIENDVALEVVERDPFELFTPELAVLFEAVPDHVTANSVRDSEGEWNIYDPPLADEGSPLPPLDQLKADHRALVNAERDRALNAGVEFDGVRYDSDQLSRGNLTGIIAGMAAGVPLPEDFVWRSEDNVNIPMDQAALLAFGAAMLAHVNAVYAWSWSAKDAIASAEDETDVQAVSVTYSEA